MKRALLLLAGVALAAAQNNPLGSDDAGSKDLQAVDAQLNADGEGGAVVQGKMTAVSKGTAGADFVAMAANDKYVYMASKNSIVQKLAADLTQSFTYVFPPDTVKEVTAMQLGRNLVYAAVRTTQDEYQLWMLDENLKTVHQKCALAANSGMVWAIAATHDDAYVFTGHNSNKLNRLDPVCGLKTLTLPGSDVDVRSMEVDKRSLFANSYGGRVFKIEWSSFSSADTHVGETLEGLGNGHVLAGTESDDTHVFVSVSSDNGETGATVLKIRKSDMTVVHKTRLEVGESTIAAMDSDALSVYITTDNDQQPRVLRLNKETMEVEDRLMLGAGTNKLEKGIVGIAHGQDRLYVGADTSPATFVELNPGSFYRPKDCKVNAWGGWSSCARPWGTQCGTGTHTRSRTIAQQATAGGAQCPKGPQLKNVEMCDTGTKCAEAPHRCPAGSGETYRTDTRAQYTSVGAKRPTCSDRAGSGGVQSDTGACDCPKAKPYWHEVRAGIFRCVSATECDANYKDCSHSKCRFLAGRVKVFHHNKEAGGGGFKCVHDTGRTGNCHCYCGYKGSSPSDPANDHIAMLRQGHPNSH